MAQFLVENAQDINGKGLHRKKRNYTEVNNKGLNAGVYVNSIPREEIIRETKLIFEQHKQYNIFTPKLYEDFCRIAFRRRSIGSVENMVGKCTFEPNEKRAPKSAPSSEFFVALSKINNFQIYENHEKRFLSPEEGSAKVKMMSTSMQSD